MTGIEVCFTGRLGRDPELMHVKGGELPLLTFSCVVDQQHQIEDQPATWIKVAAFGDLAEQMAEPLVKGTKVYVEGKLEARIWQPEAGPPRLNLNVTATTVQPLGQIGRRLPTRGQRTHDRARDVARHVDQGRARAAGEAVLRATRSANVQDGPPQAWLDDTEAALRDLEFGPGR